MYKVSPKGINIKQNDRSVPDGFLQESINLQWKDGSYRPIPERLESGIFASSNDIFIMHKVSDEDRINVLLINSVGVLFYYGSIVDGDFTLLPLSISGFPTVTDFDSLSFTILNGLVYFMSVTDEFYYRLQYNEVENEYEVKDMYAWKDLIPFFPQTGSYTGIIPIDSNTNFLVSLCGIICIRFTLVLNTGEEVLHSPIYSYYMYGVNYGTFSINKDDSLANIHALINTNLDFNNTAVLDEEISAINIYASIPFYITKVGDSTIAAVSSQTLFTREDAKGEVQRMAEEPFYLIKTIDKPGVSVTDENILFYVGEIDVDLDYPSNEYSKVNTDTIAAGPVMPVDNFTYHKIFGKITSINGRLIVSKPKTILSTGHIRALSMVKNISRTGFYIDTEDGSFKGVGYKVSTELSVTDTNTVARGILSYPDSRASYVGGNTLSTAPVKLYKLRANKGHNLSCAFNFKDIIATGIIVGTSGTNFTFSLTPSVVFEYGEEDIEIPIDSGIEPLFYTSDNRIQFSESGEYSVWPALNSYRVGEGRIQFTGSNSVDPSNTDYIAPLIIGTSDGVYTVNFDVTGAQLIQSITKTANLPALSSRNVLIDQNLIYISDKGLIVINSGKVSNITKDYFPERGNGGFSPANNVYPNYNLLTEDFFIGENPYILTDIVDYMKGALFAYDGRRDNVWCSNPSENFSLIYNLGTRQWTTSTYIFSKVIDFNGILNTSEGEIYSRFLVRDIESSSVDILSGEDENIEVETHLLTRPIKMRTDEYKKIQRLISRCEIYKNSSGAYYTFGLWGKQDMNKSKVNIALAAYKDNDFPENNVRQDIPVGKMKGKYKTITILQGGKFLPNSSLDSFEIVAIPVENNILR